MYSIEKRPNKDVILKLLKRWLALYMLTLLTVYAPLFVSFLQKLFFRHVSLVCVMYLCQPKKQQKLLN